MSRLLSVRPSNAWRWRLGAFALALILLHPPRARAEWVSVPQAGNTDWTASYDTSRARFADGVLEVWTREQGVALRPAIVEDYRRRGLSPVQVQDFGERFARRMTRWRVDCDKRTARTLAIGDYDADGRATFTQEGAGEEGQIWPDSAVDAAAQALCRKPATRARSVKTEPREARVPPRSAPLADRPPPRPK